MQHAVTPGVVHLQWPRLCLYLHIKVQHRTSLDLDLDPDRDLGAGVIRNCKWAGILVQPSHSLCSRRHWAN